jgi:hypothetical protein
MSSHGSEFNRSRGDGPSTLAVGAFVAGCVAVGIVGLLVRGSLASRRSSPGEAPSVVAQSFAPPPAADAQQPAPATQPVATPAAGGVQTNPAAAPVPEPPPGPTRITLQYQEPADRQTVLRVRTSLKEHPDWRVGSPEHILPAGENRPETYGGVRYFFEGDSVLARVVCTEVQAELARRGYTVTMPLWPMLTRQRLGLFHARPGLIEVWISPLPAGVPGGGPAQPGPCGR